MSAGYAARLKDYPNKGVCGLPELRDTTRTITNKIDTLVDLVHKAKKGQIVILTGAGISTSAGIPDFRGPQGIWTIEQEENRWEQKQHQAEAGNTKNNANNNNDANNNKKRKRQRREPMKIDFANAKPTYTHRAIVKLVKEGIVKFVVTQNVDGLHRRSGLSRNKHAVLHGCVFTEKCENENNTCGAEHFRNYDVGGMSFQLTGRRCELCGGCLRDTLLDWEDPLPEDDLERSTMACESADLVLCLGTSLRIEPAGSLPLKAKQFVVVNLQETAKNDHKPALIIRSRVDDVMQRLMIKLGLHNNIDDNNDDDNIIERIWKPDHTTNNSTTPTTTNSNHNSNHHNNNNNDDDDDIIDVMDTSSREQRQRRRRTTPPTTTTTTTQDSSDKK